MPCAADFIRYTPIKLKLINTHNISKLLNKYASFSGSSRGSEVHYSILYHLATAVRISEKLVNDAKKFSRIDHRSLTGQIEHWARMGKCAEENPDLTYSLIKDILIGVEELEQGEKSEYK